MSARTAFLILASITTMSWCSATAIAQEAGEREIVVAEQALPDSLKFVADEFGLQLAFFSEVAEDFEAPALNGSYTQDQALEALLAETMLEYGYIDNGTVVVRTKDQRGVSDSKNSTPQPVLMAQNQSSPAPTTISSRSDEDDEPSNRGTVMDEIVVTGTLIRGIAPESSPVLVFDREDIDMSGAATAQDFIQTLPQNFRGGSNSESSIPNDNDSSFNTSSNGGSFGSSVNLRGLGSGSTLVLLNGHRLAPSSGIGNFADISMIPASALERVEIMTDGASSIYGGDAVAGVVNFITRDDFDGIEASVRYGTVTEGNLEEYRASITGGKNWNSGNAFVVYEYFDQSSLSAGDREFSQDANLPNDMLPHQERHSVLASVSQVVSSDLQLFADFTYLVRDTQRDTTQTDGDIIDYSAASESFSISGRALWELSDVWGLDFSSNYSGLNNETARVTLPGGSGPTEGGQDRIVDSKIWTMNAIVSGTLFELVGGDVQVAIGAEYRYETFENFWVSRDVLQRDAKREALAVFGELHVPIVGPSNAVPGIDRFELNLSGRYSDFSDFGSTSNPKVGVLWSPFGGLNLRGSYSTSFKPPPLGRVGANDLTASAALQSFWNNRRGFIPADPSIEDVVVLVTFGTADNLEPETSTAFTAGLDFNKQTGSHSFDFSTTYFDIDYEDRLGSTPLPGSGSVFDAPNIVFNFPEQVPDGTVIFNPSESEVRDFLDGLSAFVVIGDVDPLDTEIVNLAAVRRSLARTKVRGWDFDVTYAYESDIGRFLFGVDGTYLINFQRQAAATTPAIETSNTWSNPVDFKLRGRAGYHVGGFAANLFVNYVDSYRVDNREEAEPIDLWTTIDVNLSYNTEERLDSAILRNLVFRLSVRNLFDESPPSTGISSTSFGIYGYDPANASPLERFVAIDLTKSF